VQQHLHFAGVHDESVLRMFRLENIDVATMLALSDSTLTKLGLKLGHVVNSTSFAHFSLVALVAAPFSHLRGITIELWGYVLGEKNMH
jgi:hypothetical protein